MAEFAGITRLDMLKFIRIISIILILIINNINIILKGAEIQALTININPQDDPYSKENFQKPQPKPVNNFNHKIYNYFISFMKEIGNNSYNDLKQITSNNSYKYYFVNDNEKEQSKKYSQNIINAFTKSSKKIAERIIKDKIKINQFLEKGITLKINLTKILSTQKTITTKPNNKHNNKIIYTTVLTNIIDHNNHHNKYAAVYHNDIEAHIYNKNYVETQWIILPIEENPKDNIFNFIEPTKFEVIKNEISKTNKFFIPKLSFNTNIKISQKSLNPTTFNNAPFFLISLKQEEDLYSNQMELNLKMKLINIQHSFKIPLYKNLYILQNYDKKFALTQTSLKNINLNKNIIAEINYVHKEQQYLFVTSYTKPSYNLQFKSQINTNRTNNLSTKTKEMYWLELNAKL